MNRAIFFFLITFSFLSASETIKDDPLLSMPGIYTSYKVLRQKFYTELRILKKKAKENNQYFVSQEEDLLKKQYELNPLFLFYLWQRTSPPYRSLLPMAIEDECYFLSLIENRSLGDKITRNDFLIIDEVDGEGGIKPLYLSLQQYLAIRYKSKCYANHESKERSKLENISYFFQQNFHIPQSPKDCHALFQEWHQRKETPYLCRYNSILQKAKKFSSKQSSQNSTKKTIIRTAQTIQEKIDKKNLHHLENFCSHLHDEKKFCQLYLDESYWNQVLIGEGAISPMKNRCHLLLQSKQEIKKEDLKKCKDLMIQSPHLCTHLFLPYRLSLMPSPDCQMTSESLNKSKMTHLPQDCPMKSPYPNLISSSRIISYFSPKAEQQKKGDCQYNNLSSLYHLLEKNRQLEKWKHQFCYFDAIEKEEKCLRYIPGNSNDDPASETRTLEKVLSKMGLLAKGSSCQKINRLDYNPLLLRYKRGCFLLEEQAPCLKGYCPSTLILDAIEINTVKMNYGHDYSFTSFGTNKEERSLFHLIKTSLKLNARSIFNVTDLSNFLQENEKKLKKKMAIMTLCIEDVLPSFFPKKSFNQCTPENILISAIEQKEGQFFATVNFSVDDVYTPRTIEWNFLYQGMINYQQIHPSNQQVFYAIEQ